MTLNTKANDDATKKARSIRHQRARTMLIKMVIGIFLPTLAATFYYGFIASDIYQSHSIFTVQTSEIKPSLGLESLIGSIAGSGSTKDALSVKEFILSRDMLILLDKDHDFLSHYKNTKADWWSRLGTDSSFEDAYKFYLKTINVNYETLSGSLTLTVKAYSADKAKLFADTILKQSENMVNKLSERVRLDQISFAKAEVENAENRLKTSKKTLLEFQNKHADFNPGQSATTALTIRGELEATLAMSNAELSQAQAIMRPNAPKVVALRQRVKAIRKQVELKNTKLTGANNTGLNESVAQFEWSMLEKEFAQKEYQSAMASFEMAKMEASRQSRYLATIARPSLPDEATHPKRLKGILTAFLVSFAIFGILSLLIASIREHARI